MASLIKAPYPDGGAPFSPADLSGLLRWYKADALSLANNDPVPSWLDSSPSNVPAAQGATPNQPIFKTGILNGKPVCRFNTMQWLTMSLSLGTACSLFVVTSPGAGSGYKRTVNVEQYVYLGTAGSPANSFGSFYGNGSAWGTVANWGATPLTTGTAYLLESINDGTTDHGYTNAASVGSRANAMTAFTGQTCAIGADSTGAQGWDGDIAEIILYNRAINSTERGQVETYAATKYAL